jgi:beta-N-acetylhexosaminidase
MPVWLTCGVAGTRLDSSERAELESIRPGGVVLFRRNVRTREELVELVGELRELPSRPYVAIDLEGGRVNRLEPLIGALPPAAAAARGGPAAIEALGTALGAACAHFGIGVDYAPVLDVARAGSHVGGEDRCFGSTAVEAAAAAGVCLAAIERFGVAACLKHYPGLGSGAVDSHLQLPELGDEVRDECAAFDLLCSAERAVMVAHAVAPALGDGLRPGSLSPLVVGRLTRRACGPIIADDLEMGALGRFGTLGERAAAALLAGCDQVLVCNALDARASVVAHVERWAARSAELARAVSRCEERVAGFGRRPLAAVTWAEVVEAAEQARADGGRG